MGNQPDKPENQNEYEPIVQKTSKIKMRIWNIACIIFFGVGIAFVIVFWNKAQYDIPIINYKWLVMVSAIAAIIIIALCFFRSLKKIGAVKFIALILSVIILAAGWYIYFRYIPKYWLTDGCAIVKADPEYASCIVEPRYYRDYIDGNLIISTNVSYQIKDNPFYEWGYILNVIKDGKVIAWIAFDTATGKYELFYEPKDEYVK